MTALAALSHALDEAHLRERQHLAEMDTMRSDMARLERAYEQAHRDLLASAALIEELGSMPAKEAHHVTP